MEHNQKPDADKVKNYSAEQEQALMDAAPVSYAQCLEFADMWGKKPKSVISKVQHLGLEYIPKPKPSKKVSKGDTKAVLVYKIEQALKSEDYLDGLEKATSAALVNLLGCIKQREQASD